jgi:hypothetical protein
MMINIVDDEGEDHDGDGIDDDGDGDENDELMKKVVMIMRIDDDGEEED